MTSPTKSNKTIFIVAGIIILAIVIFFGLGDKKSVTEDAATAVSGAVDAATDAVEGAGEAATGAVNDAVTPAAEAPAAEAPAAAPATEAPAAEAPAQGQ